MAQAFIGTSGYNYKHWSDGVFYPSGLQQSRWLEFYSSQFSTVELNVTFYHLPQVSVFRNWCKSTPDDFTFSIKGSRYITHMKKLNDCYRAVSRFFTNASTMCPKLQIILWQLPPYLQSDIKRLESFLKSTKAIRSAGVRQAFEFRNESWVNDETFEVLDRYSATMCFADTSLPGSEWAGRLIANHYLKAPYIYVRFHGSQGPPIAKYTTVELTHWQSLIDQWVSADLDVYCYFNNDVHGYAIENARSLKLSMKPEHVYNDFSVL